MKQQKQISLVKGWRNRRPLGSKFSPIGMPENYPIWTITYRSELEFLNDSSIRALSGFERAGISGQRVIINVTLRAGNPDEYERLRQLISSLSSQNSRVAYEIDISTILGMELDISGVEGYSLNDIPFDTLNGVTNCYIRNVTRSQDRLAVQYSASTKTVTLEGESISSWQTGDNYEIVLLRSQPTVLGIAPVSDLQPDNVKHDAGQESWVNGFVWCNMATSGYDLQRELTVGTQVVNLQFRSVERFDEIPDFLTIERNTPNPIT